MNNPSLTHDQIIAIAAKNGLNDKVTLFGFRSSTSKYGEYDDTLAILTPDNFYQYKGNTLPSKEKNGLAVLQPGIYDYAQGLHGMHHLNTATSTVDKQIYNSLMANKGIDHTPIKLPDGTFRLLPYWAFRQHGPVLIKRIGSAFSNYDNWPVTPAFIDLHKGGYNLTSSEGCQTFYPDHWEEVRRIGYNEMDKYNQTVIKYCLIQF